MTERVREIKFEHFRGLPNYACKLSGKNLAVFGGNGKGKSAIVDGLEFLFSGRVARFPRRRKIAEYAGERILDEEATRRAPNRRILRTCDIDGCWSLDGSRGGNGTHYINHCCAPNAFVRTIHGHVLFFALRDIHAGEEITIDYEQTLHPDSKRSTCGAGNCRGTINRQ